MEKKVGMTSSDGVFIDNVKILKGDYSGPDGAKTVLKDPSIDHGVFEVARGGIIRRGLGFDSCDIGILLNVTSDHLGFGGIDTLEELARLKSTVPEAVKASGYAILNADDPLVLMRADKIKGKLILFSKDINNPKLLENLEKGNMNISVINGNVVLQRPGGITYVENINDIPITFEGKATFNIDNVLAAVGATFLLGIDVKDIRVGLNTFNPSISQSPGRMNIIDIGDYKVVIDYCHNVGSVHASGNFLRSLMPGRKIRVASGVGNRRTEDIMEFGEALAQYYEIFVICDPAPRTRKPGETPLILRDGMIRGGANVDNITITSTESQAALIALEMAMPGDVVVIQVDNVFEAIENVLNYKEKVLGKNNI